MNFRMTFPLWQMLFLLGTIILSPFVVENLAAAEAVAGLRKVVIDAGHGGPKYPGASYRGYHEKDINLQVALKLGEMIRREMPEVEVIFTRTTDKQFSSDLNRDLQARADIANKAEADLFISIHANAARSTAARGVETLIMGESEKETRLNEAVLYANNKEEFLDMSDERTAAIVRAYIQNLQFTYGEYSEAMARIVQRNYAKAGYHDRGVKRQPLKVLYATDMPSILTEIGFMSNPGDLKLMTTESGQTAIARSLLASVREYDAHLRRLRGEGGTAAPAPAPTPAPTPAPESAAPAPEAPKPVAPASETPSAPVVESGYTIQIMASASPVSLNHSDFRSVRGQVQEYTAAGSFRYKYCVGRYATRQEAQRRLQELRKHYKGAFVVHFTGNEIK